MAITTAGGREYYTDAHAFTVPDSYADLSSLAKGRVKGILHTDTDAVTYKFPSGAEIIISAAASQIVPLVPKQIKHNADANSTYYALY